MKTMKLVIGILLTVLMQPVFADMSLDAAKSQGLVGEDSSGYLAAVTSVPSADVEQLVASINQKRRAQYEKIAQANSIDVAAVEQLAAKKAIEKTQPGHYVRLPGGDWKRK